MNTFLCTRIPQSQASPQAHSSLHSEPISSDSASRSGPPQPSKLTLADFALLSVIGEGGTSLVYLAQEKSSGLPVALKQIAKADLSSSKQVSRVHAEKDILSKLNHPLVVKFYGCFQDLENLYIGLEFLSGGDLYGWLARRVTLSTAETRFYAAEIAAALCYIHSQGIVYRDLKAENVLIGSNGHIKLADFGLAKKLLPGERTFSLCGTPQCMAPEVIRKSGYCYEVDWWSFGILLHEMITGRSPFDASSAYEIYSNIISRQYRPPGDLDPAVSSLLVGLLEKDPGRRLKGEEILRLAFFKDIDWNCLNSLRPPYIPVVKGPLDASHFDHYDLIQQAERASQAAAIDQYPFVGF